MDKPTLPHRSDTTMTTGTTGTNVSASISDDEVIPESDFNDTTNILVERLQAFKHMCGYLENYVTTTQKVQRSQSKEFEKILKTISDPLKEGHHFDQGHGGVAGLFESLRGNTQGIAEMHLETEKRLKLSVLPILEGLHNEIKVKAKEIKTGAAKAAKQVSRARGNTQKHIELLGQYSASFDSTKNKVDAGHDPYVLSRGVYHRLNKQVVEENTNLQEILAVQNSFPVFETHILETVQNALNQFFQCMGAQTDRQRAMYADMVGYGQQIPADFEWANFFERNDASLINPNAPQRTMSNIKFPNQDHRATKPVIEGVLERKSRAMVKGYSPGYYVVTPAGYLHGFKETDQSTESPVDPSPDISLYLPECSVGSFDGLKFSIKGKDVSSNKVGNAFHISTDLNFKARTKNELEGWQEALSGPWGSATPAPTAAVAATAATPISTGTTATSNPPSPTIGRKISTSQKSQHVASPISSPMSPSASGKAGPFGDASLSRSATSTSATGTTTTEKSDPQEDGVVSVKDQKK